jgi:hypothetical protein
MPVTVQELQNSISEISNSVTRAAAQELLNIASASGNPDALISLDSMLSLSATGVGTAIFYSGVGPNGETNRQNALDVKNVVLSGNAYLWDSTPLGIYIENSVTTGLEAQGYLPSGFRSAAIDYVSAKMGQSVGWVERSETQHLSARAAVLRTRRRCWVAASLRATFNPTYKGGHSPPNQSGIVGISPEPQSAS